MRMQSVFQAVQLPVLNHALLCIPVAYTQWAGCLDSGPGSKVCVWGSSEGYDFGRHAKASCVEGCVEVSLSERQKLLVQERIL